MQNTLLPVANWSYPTTIWFGVGRIAELAKACGEAGMTNPLFVTDKSIITLPIAQKALSVLEEHGVETSVFSQVDINPTEINLNEGVASYRQRGHDGVIAFGGGSALDLGKLIAFQQGQTRSIWDFEDIGDWWTRANNDTIAPIIAVPTTAGTGSEVGRAGVLSDSVKHVKKIIFHPKILPSIVICDAELTVGMPPLITAGTGMDAFIHCFEAYSSPHYHPMSQGIALEGMQLALTNLPHAYAQADNLLARANMMSAAAMGAVAFQKGLGATHSISHSVGALYNTHHGITNAVVLPAVMRLNRPAIESRVKSAAAYLGINGGFDGFYQHIMALRQQLAIPNKLSELGVDNNRLDQLIKLALADPSSGGNPIILTEENMRQLLIEVI